MPSGKPIHIAGFGKYLPKAVPSAELEERHGLPAGWSERYSGVRTRHHAQTETNGFMGASALEDALQNCGLRLSDIDMILSAAATFDYPLPNRASIIKSELHQGAGHTVSTIDIDSTCLSFVSALEMASGLLDGKRYRNIAIVSSEIASRGLNVGNWETLTLFGDAAVACILQYAPDSGSLFIKGDQRTYSEGVYDTIIRGGGNRYPFRDHPYDQDLHSFAMNGKNLLRLAHKKVPEFMTAFFSDLPVSITDVPVVIPHQASRFGIQLFRSLFPFRDEQVRETLIDHGNCIAASIPLTLYDSITRGVLRRGDLCLLCGTSAGFSIGSALIKY